MAEAKAFSAHPKLQLSRISSSCRCAERIKFSQHPKFLLASNNTFGNGISEKRRSDDPADPSRAPRTRQPGSSRAPG
ncbi:predicted protein [Chaetomium globosum CBS 148.51]|uniref:Uncharacterized protein n=1 Tax=Chaetomium globosum (strain ATCC 6205 / CBS 148.51 / DSM 1962 / NBRC 6347 / NRRL 1970) TaxID=306901 RepID=Q2H5P5_CHAGB|nr:uncharacterized protein CHGG_06020 [Chaetomium globosum CBS 148.51]EAQ89401.1 predicted protein [Chaetomium globosum CBS 148.51]